MNKKVTIVFAGRWWRIQLNDLFLADNDDVVEHKWVPVEKKYLNQAMGFSTRGAAESCAVASGYEIGESPVQ